MTTLEIRDLQVRVATTDPDAKPIEILKGVNLTVKSGETHAIMGPNGSGKSTLARAITGLLPPSRGKMIFNGRELSNALPGRTKDDLRELQMIYQMADTAMNPRQTEGTIIGRPLQF